MALFGFPQGMWRLWSCWCPAVQTRAARISRVTRLSMLLLQVVTSKLSSTYWGWGQRWVVRLRLHESVQPAGFYHPQKSACEGSQRPSSHRHSLIFCHFGVLLADWWAQRIWKHSSPCGLLHGAGGGGYRAGEPRRERQPAQQVRLHSSAPGCRLHQRCPLSGVVGQQWGRCQPAGTNCAAGFSTYSVRFVTAVISVMLWCSMFNNWCSIVTHLCLVSKTSVSETISHHLTRRCLNSVRLTRLHLVSHTVLYSSGRILEAERHACKILCTRIVFISSFCLDLCCPTNNEWVT